MNGITCGSCKHFCQHYAKMKGRFVRVFCGHCLYLSSLKKKNYYTKACENHAQLEEKL